MHHKTTVVGSGVPHHSAAANRDYRAGQPGREAERRLVRCEGDSYKLAAQIV